MNASVCQRRWNLLRDNFKLQYFDNSKTDEQKDESLPKLFYCKLQNVYKNYIMNKVNETMALDEFGNQSMDTSFNMDSSIRSLLNKEQDMIKVLSINNDNASGKEKPSQSLIVLEQIKALPKDDVYIERFKTRIDPNTPLNKRYSYQTQQQSRKTYSRKKLKIDDEEPSKAINKQKDITIIYPNYNQNKLDNCDLSNINHSELSSCYIDNQTNLINIPIDLEFSTLDPSKYTDYQYLDNTTIEVASANVSNNVDNTVEIPSKKCKVEVPSSASHTMYYDQQVKNESPMNQNSNVLKNVIKNVPILPKPMSQQPPFDWPIKFMLRYEADMRNLNDKVDRILSQVSQNNRKVPLKREPTEDIY